MSSWNRGEMGLRGEHLRGTRIADGRRAWRRVVVPIGFLVVWALHLGFVGSACADEAGDEDSLLARLATDGSDVEAAFELGELYHRQGRRDPALKHYKKALEIKPGYGRARIGLGIVLNESGKSEEAIVEFDKVLVEDPENTDALCNRGQALYALRRYDEAVAHYQRALEIYPRTQLAYYLLGIAFADAGIYKEAIRDWKRAAQIDPDSETGRTAQEGVEVLESMLREMR